MDKNRYDMIGYTHIDPVWLWNRAEGMQEVKSSFASALDRMNEFADFKFMQTSISFLEWIEKNCPEMFENIRQRVREGRWEIAGGMWVEPDCDLPGGEALIRHFLYGKSYAKEKFGVEVIDCFSPDSFGHGRNLPAVLKGCGIRSYTVSRPAKTHVDLPGVFVWQSPDGSSVLAERTGGEYMAWTRPTLEFNIRESKEDLEAIGYNKKAVFYGVGNHGGGPTIDNIRSIYELRSQYGKEHLDFATFREHYDRVEAEKLPVVKKELGRIYYGCYSSDRQIKQLNRQAEWALIKAENIAAMACGIGVKTWKYPAQKLEQAWKEVLFNQFHDVLAGTSIESARNAACREFSGAIACAEEIIRDGVQAIANQIDNRGEGFPLILVNPSGVDFSGVFEANVYVPRAKKKLLRLRDEKGAEIFFSESDYHNFSPESRKGILFEAKVPAFGYTVYRVLQEGPNQENTMPPVLAQQNVMDNGILKVVIDPVTGCPSSVVKDGKELLSAASAVRVYMEDRGAWGEEVFDGALQGQFKVTKIRVLEANSMRAIIRVLLAYGNSEMRIDYILERESDLLKMKMRLQNAEKQKLIALCFPMQTESKNVCTETAFLAECKIDCEDTKPEHYQHRFADISAVDGSGMAVVNDSIYSCMQVKEEYRLVLARSTTHARGPRAVLEENLEYPYMDQGCFDFELYLLPHTQQLQKKRLFEEADRMHLPIEYLGDSNHRGESWALMGSLLQAEKENIAFSSIKQSMDGSGQLVIRAFETEGVGGKLKLEKSGYSIERTFGPHEIVTLRLTESGFAECDMLERQL